MIAVLSFTTISTFASYDEMKTDNNSISRSYINKLKESKKKEDSVRVSDDQKERKQLVSDAIQAAIKENDYEAFVKEFLIEQSKIITPTKEQFAQMVEKHKAPQIDKKYNTIQTAVRANDYEAFVKAFKTISNLATVTTETEFAKIVTMTKQQQAVQDAIKANDYEAFVKAFVANQPTIPTKEEFTKIIELQKNIKENKSEIKSIKEERKEGTITKTEANTEIKSIKEENKVVKKAEKLVKKPIRKISRLSK